MRCGRRRPWFRDQLRFLTVCPVLAFSLASPAIPADAKTSPRNATSWQTVTKALEQSRTRLHAPAATAAILRCGSLVWSGGSGTPAIGSAGAVTPDTPFILASTTKTVTATMVLQLVQQRKIALDEKLAHFYPRLPNASRITIRELLNMTSGLPEELSVPQIANLVNNYPKHHWTRDEILNAIRRPDFSPGARYAYSNTNYVVLGGIIEKVAGMAIEPYFHKSIAVPSGMSPISTFTYAPKRSSQFAHPYVEGKNGSRTDNFVPNYGISSDYWGPVWTDGGLASTAPDLGRFMESLFSKRLISSALLQEMTRVGPNDYGLGIYAKQFDGHRWLGHDGSYGGYESEDWHDPKRDVTITILTDLAEPDSSSYSVSDVLWRAVALAYDSGPAKAHPC
jgi:D-alanyl-D-alanine carboxypeptidase